MIESPFDILVLEIIVEKCMTWILKFYFRIISLNRELFNDFAWLQILINLHFRLIFYDQI